MSNIKIAKNLSIFIMIVGMMVMVGWFFNIPILKRISPNWVTMRFTTAFCFLLSGIMLYFIARFQENDRELAVIAIPILSMTILILMTSFIASILIGINVGVENLFIKDSMTAVRSVAPGRPSVATMVNFILIAMSGILTTMNIKTLKKVPAIFAVIIIVIGSVAILGYIINQPLLYFSVYGKSSAIALHAAILFVFFGLGIILIERNRLEDVHL